MYDLGHSPEWVKWLKLTKFSVVYVVLYVVKATGVGTALCVLELILLCNSQTIMLITWTVVSQTICTDLRHMKV